MEARRLKGAQLLKRGISKAEVARQLGVHRQSVLRWAKELERYGRAGLKHPGRAGRKPKLTAAQLRQIERGLKRGPEAQGYSTSLWTTERVAALIEQECGVRYHPGHVWRMLRRLGWSCQQPVGKARERNEKAIAHWKKVTWPEVKKDAARQGQTIVFIDESGLSERPHRCRTWAPRGQTPVLEFNFNWHRFSVIAGITWSSISGSIRTRSTRNGSWSSWSTLCDTSPASS